MPRRAARHREVDHLPGEDERRQNAHQRDLALAELVARLAQRNGDQRDQQQPADRRDRDAEEAIGDVHGENGEREGHRLSFLKTERKRLAKYQTAHIGNSDAQCKRL